MKNVGGIAAIWIGTGLSLMISACGGGGSTTTPPPVMAYVLTVNSTNPASGVTIEAAPADNNKTTNGTTSFTLTYNAGTSTTLTAPAKSGSNTLISWTGCTTASTVTCNVILSANTTVTANYAVPVIPTTYVLTVDSTNPTSGATIGAAPADNNNITSGVTSFTLTYNSGTLVTLTAPAKSGSNGFSSWSGCTTTSGVTCTFTLNANTTVTANYAVPVVPTTYVLTVNSTNPASGVTIGGAPADNNNTTSGVTSFTLTYNSGTSVTLTAPAKSGSNTFSSWTGCTTASTETCTVTLNANTTVTANYAVPGATVSVDTGTNQLAINPNIYGVCAAGESDIAALNAPLNRLGGETLASTYNWQIDALNLSHDWYWTSYLQDSPQIPGAAVDNSIQGTYAANVGSEPMVSIPMQSYIANLGPNPDPNTASLWSYSVAKYGLQGADPSDGLQAADPYQSDAGSGLLAATGKYIVNNPLDAYVPNSVAIQQAWLQHLIGKWGLSTTSTGVKYYILDNEPSLWSSTHRDIHPNFETYAEEYNDIVAYATAIRAADPNAKIVAPEEWVWWAMYESGLDQANGTGAGSDYATHNNTYYYPWLLQQLYAYQQSKGTKLIDMLSVHCYNQIPGGSDDSASGQATRNAETRILWDPTFVDPSWEGTLGINGGVEDWIPLMKSWVNQYYPGLEIGCTEYNWGDETELNGATTLADALGIYGKYGLSFATYWTVPAYPTYLSMQMYRNYDGKLSTFGDTSVSATVANPDNLSAYASVRTSDGALTVMVINKQTVSTPVTVNLANFASTGTAQAYQISSATQKAIASLGAVTVSSNAITTTVPSQSVTLFVIPKM
jgi:hypothetical protein